MRHWQVCSMSGISRPEAPVVVLVQLRHILVTIVQHCPLSFPSAYPLLYVSPGSCLIPAIQFQQGVLKQTAIHLIAGNSVRPCLVLLVGWKLFEARPRSSIKKVIHSARQTFIAHTHFPAGPLVPIGTDRCRSCRRETRSHSARRDACVNGT